ncbi:MAG: hypothetical protein ABIJ18_02755 [archaeon]
MKTKLIMALLLTLFLVTSCINIDIPEEKTGENEPIEVIVVDEEPVIEEKLVEELPEGQYLLIYGETITAKGMTIKITDLTSTSQMTMLLNGQEKKLTETKRKEIYNGYYFQMLEYNYKGNTPTSTVLLEITEYVPGENEYLIEKSVKKTIGEVDVILQESKSDGYIKINVCDKGSTIYCETYVSIMKGTSTEVKGYTIKNIENFYKNNQYARVEITPAS